MLRLVQQGQGYQPVCSEQVKRDIARAATAQNLPQGALCRLGQRIWNSISGIGVGEMPPDTISKG